MSELKADDLPRHLARGIAPVYLVHGDEPLFALEAADTIRAAARAAGCDERATLVAETGFKWDAFVGAYANFGLFGGRKLIDLRIPSGKPGVDGARVLEAYAGQVSADNVTLVTLPRMDKAAQASAWFSALAGVGVTIAVYPLERAALPRWIAARFERQQQQASAETLEWLADLFEGNLLAGRQEIEKLALLLPAGKLTHSAVEEAVADVARYDVFALSEAWLAGDAARALRILAALESAGEPLTLAVWQLSEDAHALAAAQAGLRSGTPVAVVLRNARVWGKRAVAMERAVKRVSAVDLDTVLHQLARLDGLAKGIGRGNAWDELAACALLLCGQRLRPAA